jgi:hypothetical protein
LDGRTRIYDASFEAVGAAQGWGSDIAGTDARCGGGYQVLASGAGDAGEPDALQAFALVNRAAAPLTGQTGLPGPITALWPSNATSVLAVIQNLTTGKYAAYLITVACGS